LAIEFPAAFGSLPWLFALFMICVDFHGLKNKIAVVALGDCITLKEEVCGKV